MSISIHKKLGWWGKPGLKSVFQHAEGMGFWSSPLPALGLQRSSEALELFIIYILVVNSPGVSWCPEAGDLI